MQTWWQEFEGTSVRSTIFSEMWEECSSAGDYRVKGEFGFEKSQQDLKQALENEAARIARQNLGPVESGVRDCSGVLTSQTCGFPDSLTVWMQMRKDIR